jgi:hypothetical protein
MGPTGAAIEKPMTRPSIKRKRSIECVSYLPVFSFVNLRGRASGSHFASSHSPNGLEDAHHVRTLLIIPDCRSIRSMTEERKRADSEHISF